GNGPGVFEMSLGSSAPYSHPHNSLIEILNEWGLIALICILTAVFTTFKKAITHLKKHKKDIITESLFYSFAIGITYSLFSGVHVMPVSQTLLFIMWGLLLGRVDKKRGQSISINKDLKALVTILFVFAWYLYLQKAISIYNNINPDKGYIYGPRFWSVGQRF
ncbi:O-antigen ligase domain-containing protein, partial [Pseudoalteromonas sp. SR45-5]|nr:O-antigen ligase domain-containing protein [Pseudoalteromonas sp. SR45-5]